MDVPFALQWARRSPLFSFKNLTIWGSDATRCAGMDRLLTMECASSGVSAGMPCSGADRAVFQLAVPGVQSNHALSAAGLPLLCMMAPVPGVPVEPT